MTITVWVTRTQWFWYQACEKPHSGNSKNFPYKSWITQPNYTDAGKSSSWLQNLKSLAVKI